LSENENPLVALVHENDDRDSIIDKLFEKLEHQIQLTELQRQYKKNKEFILTNKLDVRVYYYREQLNAPRISVCVIRDKNDIYYRGISFCSFRDIVSKEDGRDMAEARAVKAIKNQKPSEPITRIETEDIILSIKKDKVPNFQHKSAYGIVLTGFEKTLVKPKTENV